MKKGIVSILGAGPAGASAAITARSEDCAVHLIERSKFPRHKVCGEFFSPEIAAELDRLGAWDAFLDKGPDKIRHRKMNLKKKKKTSQLPESAWGLSRYAFDALLLDRAQALGVPVIREPGGEAPVVVATGRNAAGTQFLRGGGSRLFGFKAHFEGPVDDAVELFFFDRCYVGINPVEGGRTNLCGLGPEDFLGRFGFDYDRVVRHSPALAGRLEPMTRSMKWLSTGPLQYGQTFDAGGQYLAGDALSFVDPFTGSGLLAAVKTGALAGTAAARHAPVGDYLAMCRASLRKPFEVASLFRAVVEHGWAEWLTTIIPGRLLFALTRPQQ